MDDPLWPVVRESARRFLRLQNLRVEIPKDLMNEFHELVLFMADMQPSRTVFPSAYICKENYIRLALNVPEEELEGAVVQIGLKEPEVGVCWIKSEARKGWELLVESTQELLKAGYPGCLGCGGPNSETPWDEYKSRTRIAQELKKAN